MVELKAPLSTLWRGKDAFEEVKTLQGRSVQRAGNASNIAV
ncbi:lipopolysaccharide core biosynthesis protein [Salmonella enterica subsp. salamae]|uniref:Lipopolysaccharide core biosynthesis protein n=1 Tax=Salmonella enterica subsp. salamae TaxID=59202 RepID=A0A6D2G178_SALER|nr:lipopolysaccharide core biosynthesis protein [Salmonella enterica subsp. salamae]